MCACPLFEGPLDLLLHLIEKRQMEITTVSLVAVTDQYMAYLRQWQEDDMPLANMAAFLSIATRLLFIKSQSLLPRTSKEEMTSEMESAATMAEELRTHLLEYKLAKEIARYLRLREEAGLQTYARSGLLAGIEAQLAWTPPTIIGLERECTGAGLRAPARPAHTRAGHKRRLRSHRARARQRAHCRNHRPAAWSPPCPARANSSNTKRPASSSSSPSWPSSNCGSMPELPSDRMTLFGPIALERGEKWGDDEPLDDEGEGW